MKNNPWLLILIALLGFLIINTAICQDLPPYHENNNNDSISQIRLDAFYLSLGILVFGLILCLVEIFVLFKKKDVCWDQSTIRVFGLTLVIVFGAFLITAGYSEYQIASMMGLLGTVAGYLLAKTD